MNSIKSSLAFLSYGKLRLSYGVTGNDQIGDYKYLNTWRTAFSPYQNTAGLLPTGLFNPDYAWEINRKLEAAAELGFIRDRLLLTVNYFRNRSGNQLLNAPLPSQTGSTSITKNLPALVQNTGWEVELNSLIISHKNFQWSISNNLTVPKNELISYPGLEFSTDARRYAIGYPLDIRKSFAYLGVDPNTGIYTFSGTSIPKDQTSIASFAPRYYGGIGNEISYKGWQFNFLIQFVKQNGFDYVFYGADAPGTLSNQPSFVLDRWQKTGDNTTIQRFTTSGAANTAYSNFRSSSGAITDASYARLKNLMLSYVIPQHISNKVKSERIQVYVQGQNLLTITNYRGVDPENQNTSLAPLRIITAGLTMKF